MQIFRRIEDKVASIIAWPSRPYAERLRIGLFCLVLSVALPVFIWSWLHSSVATIRTDTQQMKTQYKKAVPLVNRISRLQEKNHQSQGNISALAAAQEVTRQIKVEDKLVSIRPTQDVPGRDGVHLYLAGLNLTEILHLFSSLEKQPGLHTLSCDITRRMDNTRLVDLDLILTN